MNVRMKMSVFFIASLVFVQGCAESKPKKKPVSRSAMNMKNVRNKKNIIPVAIIGSGPAGLSAAVYTRRANRKTVVFQGSLPGGQLMQTTEVENWPGEISILGPTLMQRLEEQGRNLGVDFLNETIVKVNFETWPFELETESGDIIYALSVIIATGAAPNKLGIKGEKEYWAAGVTSCAVCDAPFYKGKDVVVIGGGDSAVEEAIQLATHVKSVTMLVRKKRLRAASRMQDRLAAYPNIKVVFNHHVLEILGDGQQVTGVKVVDEEQNKEYDMPIDGVFLAIGHTPNTALFADYLEMERDGYIKVLARSQQTSVEGVFAAGDAEDFHYRQAGVAAGSGIKAALDADAFLTEVGFSNDIADEIAASLFRSKKIDNQEVMQLGSMADFEREVVKSDVPVVVDFYADYCPSCIAMLPAVQEVAQESEDRIKFVKVDTEKAQDITAKFHVYKIPVLLVFKDGKLVARHNDAMSKKELREFVEQFMQK